MWLYRDQKCWCRESHLLHANLISEAKNQVIKCSLGDCSGHTFLGSGSFSFFLESLWWKCIVNSLPFIMTWTWTKKGAMSEPAEMGVPFADHSANSRTNKKHPCLFICGFCFLSFFCCFFICICSMLVFLQCWGLHFRSVWCNYSPLLVWLKVTNVLHRCHVSMLMCRTCRFILYLL